MKIPLKPLKIENNGLFKELEVKGYKHLKWNDRLYIERLLRLNFSKKEIAEIVGCSLATIYNELKRGAYEHLNGDYTTSTRYSADIAEQKYRKNLQAKGQRPKIQSAPKLSRYIGELIAGQHYSPAAVLMEITNNSLCFEEEIKSVQTIYTAIRKGNIPGIEMKNLPRKGRQKRKKRKVEPVPAYWKEQKGQSIEERPGAVNLREEFGHWEMDSVVGKSNNRKTVLVLTERKTRLEIVEQLQSHTQHEVAKALNRLEKRYGADFYKIFRSITVDNGSEFKDYISIEQALRRKGKRTNVFYCHPRSPQERGSNENNNILLRRCTGLGKGTDFDRTLTRKVCKDAENWINTYPRKSLGGRCSQEAFNDELEKIGCRLIE